MNAPTPTTTAASARPLFDLGRLLITPAALSTLEEFCVDPLDLVARHLHGDWGALCETDRAVNAKALEHGDRLVSSYTVRRTDGQVPDVAVVWIMTDAADDEGQRACSTVMLPGDY